MRGNSHYWVLVGEDVSARNDQMQNDPTTEQTQSGTMSSPTDMTPSSYIGKSGGEHEGPFFHFMLSVTNGMVSSVTFKTYGCIWSNAIAMAVAALIEKRPLAEVVQITEEEVRKKMIDCPRGKRGIVALAVKAVRSIVITQTPT
jgi:NifU-like protein involved in Fe-S cluster formation